MTVRFTILGPVRARRDPADLDLGGRQQRLVLALLLAGAGSVVSLADLVDTVWEDDPPSSAVNVVHRYIGTLRRLIEPDLPVRSAGAYLLRHGGGYRLRVTEESLDLLRFRALVGRARQSEEAGEAVRLYAEAFALWNGHCAAGLEPVARTHPAFVAIEAERAQAVRDAADIALRGGHVRLVLPALRQAAAVHPLDEALQARLLSALAADSRQAEAIVLFQVVRRRLRDELGISPGPELLDAYDRLLHQGDKSAEPTMPTPAQLPPDHPFFSGRDDVLARAQSLLDDDRRLGRDTVALAVDGMPGVGKTTLAVHLGHRLAPAYPDGQLYADLRGFAAQGLVMTATEALRGFLSSLGVPQETLPAELHALAGLYRSILADRRVLVVLDNCRDFEQIRHLLPSAPGSLAIVTSRNRITGLITTGGAHPVPLDLPAADEARDGLTRRLGADRMAREPAAVAEIIERCGRLPLALAVVAARAAAMPETPLAEIAAELTLSRERLDSFDADLPAVFSWSYRALTPVAQRMFRLLSLHPGPDVSDAAAASLAGLDPRAGRALLAELTAHVLVQKRSGRYHLHDLLRAYAAGLSDEEDAPRDREAALARMFDHYRSTAHAAHLLMEPQLPARRPPGPEAGVTPEPLAGSEEAMAWFAVERRVLTAVISLAAAHGASAVATHIALTMQNFLHFTGRTPEWAAIMRRGLATATASGDVEVEARLSRSLAGALFVAHDLDGAMAWLARAEELASPLGNQHELAIIELNRAYVRAEQNRHDDAIAHGRRALALLESVDQKRDQVRVRRVIAGSTAASGRVAEGIDLLHETLALSEAIGDVQGVGYSWVLIGKAHRQVGDRDRAVASWERAASCYRRLATHAALAEVLTDLGDARAEAGDAASARAAWSEALAVLDGSTDQVAADLRTRLRSAGVPRAR
ncbi:SARP family transcriptional regulator [Asanoa ishikariensis]|uniref:DNA-binding transcriptional activator of the SARP family n=1 Tax=Asanoa ishikariensis TaxID=137265 RepID=A0A1H3UXU1_9ACTN|nr:BTAD domain-containing putative transcriptional regulator [Asanoa ishikariensis]GIF70007.1 SARP family transcriptional regulator [Asanoa ishikariensis]SDZ67233.1 DNA-binding transcriptional activator of the SARP family [Asanoa ishikariensis]